MGVTFGEVLVVFALVVAGTPGVALTVLAALDGDQGQVHLFRGFGFCGFAHYGFLFLLE